MRPILNWTGGLMAFVFVTVASAGQSNGPGQGLPERVARLEDGLRALQQTVADLVTDRQPGLTVVDANGVVIGELIDTGTPNTSAAATVVLIRRDVLFPVGVRASSFHGSSALFFSSTNCTLSAGGGPYVRDIGGVFPSVAIGPPGSTVYVQDPSVTASEVLTHSFIRSGEAFCSQSTNTFLSYQALPIADLSTEFTAPYRVQKGQ